MFERQVFFAALRVRRGLRNGKMSRFFITPYEAETAGFRACLRCRPEERYFRGANAQLIADALQSLKSDEIETPTIEKLSRHLSISTGYLQKTFKLLLGLTPKEVLEMKRIEKFKENLKEADVTTSLYESGFGSSRSLYEKAGETIGMTPAVYRKGGKDMKIGYAIVDSPLGKMMVAATEKGICSISFGDGEIELLKELNKEFFAAVVAINESGLKESVEVILKSLKGEKAILSLLLDVRASAFQMRVWSELRKIPFGKTRSYGQIAENLGNPKAVRAVARACATNPVALATPCHRVTASNGKLSGYRWGIERKEQLLKQEKENLV